MLLLSKNVANCPIHLSIAIVSARIVRRVSTAISKSSILKECTVYLQIQRRKSRYNVRT